MPRKVRLAIGSQAMSDGPNLELDHVQIAAPSGSEEAARRFFGDVLGLKEIIKPEPLASPGGVWSKLGTGRYMSA